MEKTWTEQEVTLLKSVYNDRKVTNNELVSMFGRTISSIQTKARRLGLNRKKWTFQEDKLLTEYYKNPTRNMKELAMSLGKSITALRARANRLSISNPPDYWAPEEDNILRENYLKKGSTSESIMELLPNRTWASILLRAAHLNLGSRRINGFVRTYSFDFDFFETIDTPEKAYWLGFAYADGSLRKNSLRFGLVIEGEKHLNKLISSINFSGKVRFSKDGKYVLSLTHPKFAKDLIEKGIVERKTWKVKYPNFLLDDLHRHFIRGVFDGDGTITTATTRYRTKVYKSPSMSICGAVPEFLEKIVEILSEKTGVKRVKVIRRKLKGKLTNTWAFSYSGTPALRIRDFLYAEEGTSMDCKREFFYTFDYSSKRPRDKDHQNDRIRKIIEENGGQLLSQYLGYEQPVTIKCNKGHVWTTLVRTLKDGRWCPKCRDEQSGIRNLQIGERNLSKWLKAKGWELQSEYKGNEEKVLLKCEHGKIFSMQAKSVKYNHAVCDCTRNNTLEYGKEKFENILREKGWKLISKYYGSFKYVTLECKHKELFKRLPGNVRLTSKCNCEKRPMSGFTGVYQMRSGKWQARIRQHGQEIRLGTFESKEEAVTARETALGKMNNENRGE